MGTPTAIHTAVSRSLNRRRGLSRGRHSSADGDGIKIKLYRY